MPHTPFHQEEEEDEGFLSFLRRQVKSDASFLRRRLLPTPSELREKLKQKPPVPWGRMDDIPGAPSLSASGIRRIQRERRDWAREDALKAEAEAQVEGAYRYADEASWKRLPQHLQHLREDLPSLNYIRQKSLSLRRLEDRPDAEEARQKADALLRLKEAEGLTTPVLGDPRRFEYTDFSTWRDLLPDWLRNATRPLARGSERLRDLFHVQPPTAGEVAAYRQRKMAEFRASSNESNGRQPTSEEIERHRAFLARTDPRFYSPREYAGMGGMFKFRTSHQLPGMEGSQLQAEIYADRKPDWMNSVSFYAGDDPIIYVPTYGGVYDLHHMFFRENFRRNFWEHPGLTILRLGANIADVYPVTSFAGGKVLAIGARAAHKYAMVSGKTAARWAERAEFMMVARSARQARWAKAHQRRIDKWTIRSPELERRRARLAPPKERLWTISHITAKPEAPKTFAETIWDAFNGTNFRMGGDIRFLGTIQAKYGSRWRPDHRNPLGKTEESKKLYGYSASFDTPWGLGGEARIERIVRIEPGPGGEVVEKTVGWAPHIYLPSNELHLPIQRTPKDAAMRIAATADNGRLGVKARYQATEGTARWRRGQSFEPGTPEQEEALKAAREWMMSHEDELVRAAAPTREQLGNPDLELIAAVDNIWQESVKRGASRHRGYLPNWMKRSLEALMHDEALMVRDAINNEKAAVRRWEAMMLREFPEWITRSGRRIVVAGSKPFKRRRQQALRALGYGEEYAPSFGEELNYYLFKLLDGQNISSNPKFRDAALTPLQRKARDRAIEILPRVRAIYEETGKQIKTRTRYRHMSLRTNYATHIKAAPNENIATLHDTEAFVAALADAGQASTLRNKWPELFEQYFPFSRERNPNGPGDLFEGALEVMTRYHVLAFHIIHTDKLALHLGNEIRKEPSAIYPLLRNAMGLEAVEQAKFPGTKGWTSRHYALAELRALLTGKHADPALRDERMWIGIADQFQMALVKLLPYASGRIVQNAGSALVRLAAHFGPNWKVGRTEKKIAGMLRQLGIKAKYADDPLIQEFTVRNAETIVARFNENWAQKRILELAEGPAPTTIAKRGAVGFREYGLALGYSESEIKRFNQFLRVARKVEAEHGRKLLEHIDDAMLPAGHESALRVSFEAAPRGADAPFNPIPIARARVAGPGPIKGAAKVPRRLAQTGVPGQRIAPEVTAAKAEKAGKEFLRAVSGDKPTWLRLEWPEMREAVQFWGKVNSQMYRGLLGLRITTAIAQLGQNISIMTHVGPGATIRGAAMLGKMMVAEAKPGFKFQGRSLKAGFRAATDKYSWTGAMLGGSLAAAFGGGPVIAMVGLSTVPTSRFFKHALKEQFSIRNMQGMGVADDIAMLRGPEIVQATSDFWHHLDIIGFSALDAAEMVVRGTAMMGFLDAGVRMGMQREELLRFGLHGVDRTQFIYDQISRNSMYRFTIHGRFMGPLTSYPTKQAKFLKDILTEGALDDSSPTVALTRYLFWNGIIATVFREWSKAALGEEFIPRELAPRIRPLGGRLNVPFPAGAESVAAFNPTRAPGVSIVGAFLDWISPRYGMSKGEAHRRFLEQFLRMYTPYGLQVSEWEEFGQAVGEPRYDAEGKEIPGSGTRRRGRGLVAGGWVPWEDESYGPVVGTTTWWTELARTFGFRSREEQLEQDKTNRVAAGAWTVTSVVEDWRQVKIRNRDNRDYTTTWREYQDVLRTDTGSLWLDTNGFELLAGGTELELGGSIESYRESFQTLDYGTLEFVEAHDGRMLQEFIRVQGVLDEKTGGYRSRGETTRAERTFENRLLSPLQQLASDYAIGKALYAARKLGTGEWSWMVEASMGALERYDISPADFADMVELAEQHSEVQESLISILSNLTQFNPFQARTERNIQLGETQERRRQ